MNDPIEPKCEHLLRENGIHEFIFSESTMASADAYLSELEQIYKQRVDASKPLLVIFSGADRTMPLNYTMQRGKELLARYPNIGTICTAVITDSAFEARLAD